MTISSSLNAGVAGLAANANRLATISDNIANSATYGYKRVQTDFHSVVTSTGGSKYSAGGVRATTMRMIDQSGSTVTTANPTDVAIRGNGFIPVTDVNSIGLDGTGFVTRLATTGSFRLDDEGFLRTESGTVLMGIPADANGQVPDYPRDSSTALRPIQVSQNQLIGSPTTRLSLGVNLPATDTMAGASGMARNATVEYFDNLGISQTLSITMTPTVPAAGASNEWTVTIGDSAQGGATVGEYVLTFDDSRGNGGQLLSVSTTTGGAYDPATGTAPVTVASGDIDIDFGAIGGDPVITQLSNIYAPLSISKNGSPVGNMTGIEIDSQGFLVANFDVGISRRLYQIPLVDIGNPNALQAGDNQTYSPTAESGGFFLWNAGDGPTGKLISGALEQSSTDVAGELTDLIQTQRAYSSNAKVIQTVDEMLQETTNIKR
ncbi:flagellar hook-basal body complex protein [Roseicyclus sp. F158]|uniref:Flagellar hook protein FlgE n=1 Tax=Tropicimonas omnivorans TaxID=3075590 RepID=A0ABU3DD78_9RHOB|nr:flagellar hook-basal body complex protein [Roseicyclus sp. F158]MDT0681667.1 flagellar hook-basal body complex protein [Roseicyclus sp. F158]